MQRSGKMPAGEDDAAIVVYERLSTARAIAKSLLAKPGNADVLAVFGALMQQAAQVKKRPASRE
jgi:hypothetical protein